MKLQSVLGKSSIMHWSVVSAGDSFAWTSVNYFYSLSCQSTKYHFQLVSLPDPMWERMEAKAMASLQRHGTTALVKQLFVAERKSFQELAPDSSAT